MSSTTVNFDPISKTGIIAKGSLRDEFLYFWLLSGLSIVVAIVFFLFVDKSADLSTIGATALYLSFLVNYPHFTASYILLYSDFRKNILSSPRYVWAAIVSPILLFGGLAYALINLRADFLGYGMNMLYFLVGWHYMKQVFGVVIVTCARRKFYFSKTERYLLLLNLFSIWAVSYLGAQTFNGTSEYWGVKYNSLGLSPQWANIAYYVFLLTLFCIIWSFGKRYWLKNEFPRPVAVAAIASLYIWYLPVFFHPHYYYLIPFFHGLQYLVLVWSFKRNKLASKNAEFEGSAKRGRVTWKLIGFAAASIVLGALAFEIIPKALDRSIVSWSNVMGPNPFVAAFIIFINIHHYFIDNTIWKSSNAEVKEYLFASD